MVTVAGAWLSDESAPVSDILLDLVEMSKGIQHPVKGIFLRHFLNLTVRVSSALDRVSVDTAVAFVLANFVEMSKLWVKLSAVRPRNSHEQRMLT
ncbi:vacuolar protein sorting-associated protein 35, partial [Kipferlia bialata]|eukprot:g16018.t1